jgi:hypothetical protein
MVYAFFVGLFVGLPVGCYLRERGYTNKVMRAYEVFTPVTDVKKSDEFKSTNKQFYEDLKRGLVSNEDFERYIYGGNRNEKGKDERD